MADQPQQIDDAGLERIRVPTGKERWFRLDNYINFGLITGMVFHAYQNVRQFIVNPERSLGNLLSLRNLVHNLSTGMITGAVGLGLAEAVSQIRGNSPLEEHVPADELLAARLRQTLEAVRGQDHITISEKDALLIYGLMQQAGINQLDNAHLLHAAQGEHASKNFRGGVESGTMVAYGEDANRFLAAVQQEVDKVAEKLGAAQST